MTGFVYILRDSQTGKQYIGSTNNLSRRLSEHLHGRVHTTSFWNALTLHAYRHFPSIQEAAAWEKKYKQSHSQLKRDLDNGLFQVGKA